MLKNINRIICVLGLLIVIMSVPLQAGSKYLAKVYTYEDSTEDNFSKFIEKKLKKISYVVTNSYKRVDKIYKKKYGSTKFDLLSYISIVNEDAVRPMLNVDPKIATFSPFNLVIYRYKGNKDIKIAHLMPEAILNMSSIFDKKLRSDYLQSFESLDNLFTKDMKMQVKYIEIDRYRANSIMHFEIPYKLEWNKFTKDIVEDFQKNLQKTFQKKGYMFTGFKNFKGSDNEGTLANFEEFWTYSFCNIKQAYEIMDTQGANSQAELLAPCSMYMYIEKGSNKISFGIPRISNLASMLGIKDKNRVDLVKKIDKNIIAIMRDVKAKEILKNEFSNRLVVVLPTPPKPVSALKVITVGGSKLRPIKRVKLSTLLPLRSNIVAKENKEEVKKVVVGLSANGRVSAHLRGKLIDTKVAQKKLEDAGFKILSVSTIDKKKLLTTIVFTNDALQNLASKKNRGFMSNLRLLVDKDNKQISITNPYYFSCAYMQDENDEKVIKKILASITKTFTDLKNSKDNLKYTLLPKYQFMASMPYYNDMIEVSKAKTSQEILEKAKAYKGGKRIIFTQKLSKDRMLIGVKLGKRTSKFIKKIGTHNASLLPYPILIENGVAKILNPKYYIAASYPMLKMSEFMKIASIPDAIESDCKKFFK